MQYNLILTNKLNINIKNKIYLGEWCFSNNFNNNKEKVIKYHWDDREKLYKDYKYINYLYSKKIKNLAYQLNKYHNINYSDNFWNNTIGLWLKQFMQISYDKFCMLNSDELNKVKYKIPICNTEFENFIPNSFSDFRSSIYIEEWRTFLYSIFAKTLYPKKTFSLIKIENIKKQKFDMLKTIFKKVISFISKNIFSLFKYKYFFVGHGLLRKDFFLLNLKLKQIPLFFFDYDWKYDNQDIDYKFRNQNILKTNNFEDFIDYFIHLLIPKCYLEDFQSALYQALKIYPKRPRVIFRVSNIFNNDLFIFYASLQKELYSTKLIYGQHGGNYGIAKFNTYQDHEINSSNLYLSWGWKNNLKKIISYGKINDQKFKAKYDHKNEDILLVLGSCPKYFYIIYSIFISGQFIKYIYDQYKFINSIKFNNNIYSKLVVRFYHKADYNWGEKKFLANSFENLRIDTNKNITNSLKTCKIFVSTYNATTFLEALYNNIPTIIFWNSQHWELNEQVKIFFNDFKKNNIFFDKPDEAANFIIQNYNNIHSWWFSKKIQKLRVLFLNNYCKNSQIDNLYKTLKI